jgi:hypothetical protein
MVVLALLQSGGTGFTVLPCDRAGHADRASDLPVVQALGFCRAGERSYGAAAVWWRHCGLIAVHQALLACDALSFQNSATAGVLLPAWVTHAERHGRGTIALSQVHGVARSPPAEERTALVVPGMRGDGETATMGLCGDKLSEGRTACARVREEGRRCGGDIVPPQRTREPGLMRVDAPERERDGAAGRPRWRILRSVDLAGTAGVLRPADMMALCREGVRQEHHHEEERAEVTRRTPHRPCPFLDCFVSSP